jgi:hypothetical protein
MNFYSFHDLRHTQATLLLKGGVHPKIVSERLGTPIMALPLLFIGMSCGGYRREWWQGVLAWSVWAASSIGRAADS